MMSLKSGSWFIGTVLFLAVVIVCSSPIPGSGAEKAKKIGDQGQDRGEKHW